LPRLEQCNGLPMLIRESVRTSRVSLITLVHVEQLAAVGTRYDGERSVVRARDELLQASARRGAELETIGHGETELDQAHAEVDRFPPSSESNHAKTACDETVRTASCKPEPLH